MEHHSIDLKAAIMYVGGVILGDINAALQAAGLLANLAYVVYQFKVFKRKSEQDEDLPF